MSKHGLLRARGQPIERAVFFSKIVKIRSYSHRLTSCALDEIVGHELAAVPVKIVMQPAIRVVMRTSSAEKGVMKG
jgi:hypothetical protein